MECLRAGRPDEAGEATVEEALRIMAPAAQEVMKAMQARLSAS